AKERSERADGPRCFVVQPAPVHRIASLMEEEADLTSYAPYLCSCQTIVRALRASGLVTLTEEEKAISYLTLHERPWANEPDIPDGAELLLDHLAVGYL